MSCGEGFFCVLLKWLAEHGAAKEIVEGLEPLVRGDEKAVAHAYEYAKAGVSMAVALLTGSFAIWKWWLYREAVLHDRLEEYIRESDHRLDATREDVVTLISRPDRRSNLRQPAFARELGGILMRRNWEKRINRTTLSHVEDREMSSVSARIEKKIEVAEAALRSLRKQNAAAHTIAAALASARASRARDPSASHRFDEEALRLYSIVEHTPGHESDLVAIEGKAFHLLRLRQYQKALVEYNRVLQAARDLKSENQRIFVQSRAQKYIAVINQVAGLTGQRGGWNAIGPEIQGATLNIIKGYRGELSPWQQIELAETNYIAAYIASRNRFTNYEPDQLKEARACYERVLNRIPRFRPLFMASERRLRSAARVGLRRVERAEKGDYDLAWLFAPEPVAPEKSGKTQQPAETVSSAGSDNGMADAAQ